MEVLRQVVTFAQMSDLKRVLTSFGTNKTFTKQGLLNLLVSYYPEGDTEDSITTLVDVVASYLESIETSSQGAAGTYSVANYSNMLTTLDNVLVQAELSSGGEIFSQPKDEEEDIQAQIGEISFESEQPVNEAQTQQTDRLPPLLLQLVEKMAIITDSLSDIKTKLSSGNNTSSVVCQDIEKLVQKLQRYKVVLSGFYTSVEKLELASQSHESETDRLTHRIRELELDLSNLQALVQQYSGKGLAPQRVASQVLGMSGEEGEENARLMALVADLRAELKQRAAREELLEEKVRILESSRGYSSPTARNTEYAELIQSLTAQKDIDNKLIENLKAEAASLKKSLDEEKSRVDSMRREFANIKAKLGESALQDSSVQLNASKLANFYRTSNLPISFCNEEQAVGKYRLLQPAGTGESAPGMENLQVVRLSSRESVINIHDSHFAQFLKALPIQSSSTKKDYLGLRHKPSVLTELSRFGENLADGGFLSDYVVVYDRKNAKKRMVIAISVQYLFLHNIDNLKQVYMVPLSQLKVVSISSKNCALTNLEFQDPAKNLLLETYRRTELVIYMARMQKEAGNIVYSFRVRKCIRNSEPTQSFSSKAFFGGKSEGGFGTKESTGRDSPLKPKDRGSKEADSNFLQETLRNSKKSGFLKLQKKNFFGQQTFAEYFCVLSDIGIIGFKKYGDKQPVLFVPILGGQTKKIEEGKAKGTWELGFDSETHILQASSETETEDWLKQIKNFQKQALTAKDTLREMGKAS